jgi:hypothetical protein
MAKYKSINDDINQDLIGGDFNNSSSETVFTLGKFAVTSNFAGRTVQDFSSTLTSFPKPITLENINVNEEQSEYIKKFTENVALNYEKSDLNSHVKFGSAREFLRVAVENIINNYVGSLFVSDNFNNNATVIDYTYDPLTNISSFKTPSIYIENKYGLSFDYGNTNTINGELKNLNISYNEYVIWQKNSPLDNDFEIVGFTGDTLNKPYIDVKVLGDVFSELTLSGNTSSNVEYHYKPKPIHFNIFISELNDFEQFMLMNRNDDYTGYNIRLKQPQLLDNGQIIYTNVKLKWYTSDGYNLDIKYGRYESFLEQLLTIGSKYDVIKTDLIARYLIPSSFITFDKTDEQKNTKLLRIYGREFDVIKQFIDSLVNINKLSYNKKNNVPDQLIKNLARTFGWKDFSLIKTDDLISTFFNTDVEKNVTTMTPAELDIELWRRILINTNYFWKTKGTREALKTILLIIGIPETFINITEHVYTVDDKINPNTVELTLDELPSISLPYDNEGYPIAPIESNDFFFQISGNTDRGQAYMDNFRNVGFTLNRTIDNKKSWVYSGETTRIHESTPNYYQEDSKLVLNTKEIEVAIDISRGIEYDIYNYIKNTDDVLNSTGFTSQYSFVSMLLEYESPASVFILPHTPVGEVVVSFNGITLAIEGSDGDYYIDPNNPRKIVLSSEFAYKRPNEDDDVVVITYLYNKLGIIVEGKIQYLVVKVTPNVNGTVIPLPDEPKGDVQLTVNGVNLTQGTSLFVGDYVKNPNNNKELIIQNSELSSYLTINPVVQIAMIIGDDVTTLEKRLEFHRIDSFNTNKFYIDNTTNTYRYRLNYKIDSIENVKITINGITLTPNVDYKLNISNPFEIILPPILKLHDMIGAYYLINNNIAGELIINPIYGVGDISEMSFLEFMIAIQKRLINARDRKIISDFHGGFYPTLLKVYIDYLKRSKLSDDDLLKSRGYLFSDLYPYFNKFNTLFENFIAELLPATIIRKGSGFSIRNTAFTRQKFMYRRGVNFDQELDWLGDDGSEFLVKITDIPYYGYDGNWNFSPIGLNNLFIYNNNIIFENNINIENIII